MLIDFSVTNFRSIAAKQTFSLLASTDKHHHFDTHVIPSATKNNLDILRSAVIYGPNASGKSNFVKALKIFQKIIVSSLKNDGNFDFEPHSFLSDKDKSFTEFDINFISGNVRYNYGFKYNANLIAEEWLFAYPEGRAQKWIDRSGIDREKWYINPLVKGQKKVWIESTRDNALILSTAIQLNATFLADVKDWFFSKLSVHGSGFTPEYSVEKCVQDTGFQKKILEFMAAADFGISNFIVDKKQHQIDDLPKNAPEALRKFLREKIEENKKINEVYSIDLKTIHKTKSGNEAVFDFKDESDGTRKVFNMAGPFIDTLLRGRVLVMDEMDTSLHPLIVKYLVSKFNNPKINENCAQIIFTTHDTSLLNQNIYRRDQIWFCEKDKEKQTSIFSLDDFQVRKEDNFEKGYLGGRYGALPFVWSE